MLIQRNKFLYDALKQLVTEIFVLAKNALKEGAQIPNMPLYNSQFHLSMHQTGVEQT